MGNSRHCFHLFIIPIYPVEPCQPGHEQHWGKGGINNWGRDREESIGLGDLTPSPDSAPGSNHVTLGKSLTSLGLLLPGNEGWADALQVLPRSNKQKAIVPGGFPLCKS